MTTRTCTKCHVEQPLDDYYLTGRSSDKNKTSRHYVCKTCTKARIKAKNDANPDLARDRHLMRTYGISLAEYKDLLDKQDLHCACCGTDKPGGRWDTFCVDHDHATGAVRALLCNDCNIVLGIINDSQDLLFRFISYLAKHES